MTSPPPPPQWQTNQWQAPNMLLPTPPEFNSAATTLDKMLNWLRVLSVIAGSFSVLFIVLGLVALAFYRTVWAWLAGTFGMPTVIDPIWNSLVWPIASMYLVTGAATIAFYWLTALLIGWCREYLTMLRGVALGGALPPRTRLDALHTTFSKYITASQWAMPVLGVLLMLFPVVLLPLFANLSENKNGVGAAEGLVMGLMLLIPIGIVSVVNWLLLAALKRWLDATTNRMRGLSVPVWPAANTVGNWFIFVLVLLGLNTLSSLGNLLTPFTLGASLASLSQEDGFRFGGLSLPVTLGFALLVLFGVAQQVIQFLAVMHSRTFALQSAALLDAHAAPPSDLPMNSGNPFEEKVKLSKSPNV